MTEHNFFELSFWQGAIGNLFATLIGVTIGIPIALWISKRTDRLTARVKKYQLLRALHTTIEGNIERLKQISAYRNTETSIGGRIDLTLLNSTATFKYEVLGDMQLAIDIDLLRSRYEDIESAINNWESAALHTLTPFERTPRFLMFEKLLGAILSDIPPVIDQSSDLLKRIDVLLAV